MRVSPNNTITLSAILFIITFSNTLFAINVDGNLDDPDWERAKPYTDFVIVSPFTLSAPEYKTESKIYSDKTGIYIGIINHQPKATQNSERTSRDTMIIADSNNVSIDFDNNGISAYSFQVGNGGSKRDGIWRDENAFSDEWDGNWIAQTSSNEGSWTAEIFIPWNVATMVNVDGEHRTIGLHISREATHISKRFASAPIDNSRQRFLSSLATRRIKDYASSSLQLFTYATSRMDMVESEDSYDAGFDLFWKPDSSKQLSLTVNPDFGHVDSDKLVVNFSPTETFFSENRAFFTENQAMFDLQGPGDLRVIHTRRIGGKPDTGNGIGADISGALKYTSVGENFNFGVFSAIENDDSQSKGRDYYAARIVRKSEDYSLGYLLTFTDRPDINRDATVQTIDYSYNISEQIKLNGQIINTDVSSGQVDQRDNGGWINYQQQINNTWDHSLQFSYYGDQFEINDLGYLPRNDLRRINYANNWQIHNYSKDSLIKERKISLSFEREDNTKNDRLGSNVALKDIWYFKNTAYILWRLSLETDGADDLITRGNNMLNIKSGKELESVFFSDNRDPYRYHILATIYDQPVRGDGFRIHYHPSYHFNDNYVVSFGSWYIESDEWLVWQQGNSINEYKQKQIIANLNFDATISDKQELSFKFEWIALQAKGNHAYLVNNQNKLSETADTAQDFSLSDTAIQIRYRYKIGPLSNIYLVYSRGGRATIDEESSFSSLFSPGWDARDGDNLLFKIRYQL